ncbi:MAG: VWA domain-containing protein [Chloracidobacterium sp.]|nr:VWA domain-containing protein [Chloracidobacterium sp.]MCC6824496.1 VWA domain-containing protein [Acidobacteriota bacterium]MCO5334879.1 VWA domain-containing protein [Pyrinomonadaceae bacterium]
MIRTVTYFAWIFVAACAATSVFAQSRHNTQGIDLDGTIIPVTASRQDKNAGPIKAENLYLYENGIEQRIKNFAFDPSASRIVILVDNSQTLPTTIETLKKAVMEFAYEIFEGDQIFVLAYDEKAEIIQEWTDDAKKLDASLATFRKKGNPYLFDALNDSVDQILVPLMPGTRKTAIVLIGDGLDRGSRSTFELTLNKLQNRNVTLYALQIPDRTGGAYRRGQPKAPAVISQLAEGTGGRVFDIDDPQAAAKAICDELRKDRYLLSYLPTNTSAYDARRLFLIADEGINVRTKGAQPPNVK